MGGTARTVRHALVPLHPGRTNRPMSTPSNAALYTALPAILALAEIRDITGATRCRRWGRRCGPPASCYATNGVRAAQIATRPTAIRVAVM